MAKPGKAKLITDDGLDEMRVLMDKHVRPGAGRKLKDQEFPELDFVSTGSLGADWVCGGGFPRGRFTEISGPQQSGKSTMCLSAAAGVQRGGGRVAWVDMEYAFNIEWAERLGVNVEDLYLEQSEYGEQALRFVDIAVKANAFDLIVIDSLAALVPRAVVEGEIGDATIGALARMMSTTLPRLAPAVGRSRSAVVFINQIREKIGVMWGSNETRPGGRSMGHAASLLLDVRKGDVFPDKENPLGNYIKITSKKSRHGGLTRKEEIPLVYSLGIDTALEVVELGRERGVLTGGGSHYELDGQKLGNGKAAAVEFLRANPEVLVAAAKRVREAL